MSKLKPITSKWPQCVITGKSVTIDQARTIISKTDSFFNSSLGGGNDDEYENELCIRLGMPLKYSYTQTGEYDWEKFNEWKEKHGSIGLTYLDNNWVSSCWIGGPNGWCHIDGRIFRNSNIGKWPSWDEVREDLKKLGKAFPFLDMYAYIIDCESCEGWGDGVKRECLGGLHLKNGKVYEVKGIDPYSDKCREELKFNIFGDTVREDLRKEVKEVVGDVGGYFQERCPGEHLFRMDEAVKYFKGE